MVLLLLLGACGETSVQNSGHVHADLKIPGVFGDGRREILRDELSSGDRDQSDGQEERGTTWTLSLDLSLSLLRWLTLLSCVATRLSYLCSKPTCLR